MTRTGRQGSGGARLRKSRGGAIARHAAAVAVGALLTFSIFLTSDTAPFAEASSSGAATSSAQSSPSTTTPYYRPVTALDKYGNSPQIRNARQASARHGALIVTALSRDGAVVVCSLHRPRIGVKRSSALTSASSGGNAALRSSGHAVHVVAACDERRRSDGGGTTAPSKPTTTTTTTAVVCSGIKSDATLLVSLLRSHARRVWDRYDAIPGADRVADAASETALTFMGYDRSEEVLDGAGPAAVGDGGEEDFRMSRPFGVQTLVIGVSPSSSGGREEGSHAAIRSVDPSGVVGSWVARAMGRGSDDANRLLSQRWRRDLSEEETVETCVGVVREVVDRDAEGDSKFDREGAEIICETLSSRGLHLKVYPFQNK